MRRDDMNMADMIPSPGNIVLQTFEDGRYCSGLLGERYQIYASGFYEGQYCVFDHKTQEVLRDPKGDSFCFFNSVSDAAKFLGVDPNSAPETTNKKGKKPSNLIKPEKSRHTFKQKANSARKANSEPNSVAKKAAKVSVRGESPLGYKSPLGYLKELLRTNSELTNEAIAAMVQSVYPECKYNHSMVKYNRKKMYGG